MAFFKVHHETATDDEIAAYCSSPNRITLSEASYDNQVVKLSDNAVVKFGEGIKEEEAKSQRRAYDLINPDIVRVPFVHRYFTKDGKGYIIMEYMEGRVVQPVESSVLLNRIARILAHLTDIRGSKPGALGGGVSCGILWSEHSEEPSLHTVEDMEKWFNRRLKKHDSKLIFSESEFVLCHLDIAPRNFLLLQDNSICLLDWASAGFYPRVFEVCALRITHGLRNSFHEDVLQLGDLTKKEETQIESMILAYYNSVRFHFKPIQMSQETNFVPALEHDDEDPGDD